MTQLLKLRDEVLDLDDLSDSPTHGRLHPGPLPHPATSLSRSQQGNAGSHTARRVCRYGIIRYRCPARRGILSAPTQRRRLPVHASRPASPVHPFYFAYIHDSGNIRYRLRQRPADAGRVRGGGSRRKQLPLPSFATALTKKLNRAATWRSYEKLLN